MASREHYTTKLLPGNFYHIYSRAIKELPLFLTEANHSHFLKLLDFHLSDVLNLYAWCLMGNHFHLLVEVKESHGQEKILHRQVHERFRKCFQAYALAINEQESRYGALFQKPFKRAHVDSQDYFTQLVYYIHSNPQRHKICADFRDYKWTSYHSILSEGITKLKRKEVLDWFGGKDEFQKLHAEGKMDLDERLLIEVE